MFRSVRLPSRSVVQLVLDQSVAGSFPGMPVGFCSVVAPLVILSPRLAVYASQLRASARGCPWVPGGVIRRSAECRWRHSGRAVAERVAAASTTAFAGRQPSEAALTTA